MCFNPDKTVSQCTNRHLLARHNLNGRTGAMKLMLRAKTRQERLRWRRHRRQFGADYSMQFVFTDECRFKTVTVEFGSAEFRMRDTKLALRYHPPKIVRRFNFMVPLFKMGRCASSKHPKNETRWPISIFWKKMEFTFSRYWDTSWLTTMLQFMAAMP